MKRIGFIGAGKQAQSMHIPNYALNPACELVAVVDSDLGLAQMVAAQFKIPAAYRSYEELLKKERLDAVVVTVPAMPSSEKLICDLLTAKVAVCAEKPLSFSVPSGERIKAVAKKTGTLFRIAYHKRSDPATMFAKQEINRLVASGEIGPMTYARVHVSLAGDWIANGYRAAVKGTVVMPPSSNPIEDYAGMSSEAIDTFFYFIGALSHQFDLMRHLLGEPYRISYADPTRVLLAVTSATGVPAVFECTPYKSTKDWVEYAFVAFERGYVQVTLPAPLAINRAGTVEVFRDGAGDAMPIRTLPVFPSKSAMHAQSDNFLMTLNGKSDVMCTAGEALESLYIARDWAQLLQPYQKTL